MNLNRTAIITGGGRGIGLAIARQLGKDGFNLVLVGRSARERYEVDLEELLATGCQLIYLEADISQAADRERIITETVRTFGGIQVLVNNAGVAPKERRDLLDMTEESYDYVMGINTKAPMFLTQAVAQQMLKQALEGKKRGTVINISSFSAEVSSTSRGEYCISKAGMSMLTKLFADRLAAHDIFVHEIRPGVIETDMTAGVKDKYDRLFQEGLFPLARWGMPEDVAQAVSAFCSDKFLYTTGNVVYVDGGFNILRL